MLSNNYINKSSVSNTAMYNHKNKNIFIFTDRTQNKHILRVWLVKRVISTVIPNEYVRKSIPTTTLFNRHCFIN